jgi:DNA-binding MarR family transcriptional regulator
VTKRHPSHDGALLDAEVEVGARLRELGLDVALDLEAMAALSNVFRAANASRAHLERTVLTAHDLSFTAFTVLWVLWVWGEHEFRDVAVNSGITKGTLTGVLSTLERRHLVERRRHDDDRRRLHVALTSLGTDLMAELFVTFNRGETAIAGGLAPDERRELARLLRKLQRSVAAIDGPAKGSAPRG